MSKFDTHGGYFSPDNYIRINEGGTHDENPNGGVQMGVDPEGVPNMVEEDETVYDDYVFSDNIYVDDAMVEKHNLPAWAKGKLYSKVTDRLVEEAEERPMDPISRSGLEEMLGRLRDAQEEQKQIQQERELEDELSQLSPEELDQLEAMLTPGTDQDGGVVGELGEQGLPPEAVVGSAEPVQQTPIEEVSMMKNGGTLLHSFDLGGDTNDIEKRIEEARNARKVSSEIDKAQADYNRAQRAVSWRNFVNKVLYFGDRGYERENAALDTMLRNYSEGKEPDILRNEENAIRSQYEYVQELKDKRDRRQAKLAEVEAERDAAKARLDSLRGISSLNPSDVVAVPADVPVAPMLDFDDNPIRALTDTAAVNKATAKNRADYDPLADAKYHALGGQMNKFTSGGGMRPEDMKVMAVDDNGELVDDIIPSVVVADSPKVKAPFYLPFIPPEISEKDKKKQEEAERIKKEKEQAEEDKVNEFARAVYFGNPDATANFLFDTMLEAPSYGRRSNRFDKGGQWKKLLDGIRAYKKSLTPGGITGTYAIDNDFVRGSQFKTIKELEDSDVYRNFTNYILDNSENEDVQNYLRLLDDMTAPGVKRLFVDGKLRSGWKDLYNRRRYDQKGGVYHFSGDINNLTEPADLDTEADEQRRIINTVKGTPFAGSVDGYPNIRYADINGNRYYLNTDDSKFYTDLSTIPGYSYPAANSGYWRFGYTINPSIPWAALPGPIGSDPNDPIGRNAARLDAARNDAHGIVVDENLELNPTDGVNNDGVYGIVRRTSPYLSTFPRYAGALTAGALGLYNAAMPADEYTIPRINPVLPQGQLHLRDPRYNPLDEEQAVNTVLATNAGTNRQIMNSGIGPSVGAMLLASDYNAGRNIGTARQTVWDSNNQSRNAVTAAHNQNDSALAGFDYGQSRDRAQVLNEAAYRNAQNDMLRQRLNYDAEGQKYAAIQSSLDSVAQALSGMGQENSILNALNSNTALYHWLSPNRVAAYKVDTNESKDGGLLRKKKTKIEKEIEQQVRDLSEYGETLTKVERDERKKREAQQKIDNLWSPASPSELKRVFSGRKKKKN